jgi:hypothetical protein
MIGKTRKTWVIAMVTFALAFMAAGAPEGRGQSGVCCPNTQSIPINCSSPGCGGNINITECSGGGYGAGTIYQSVIVYCCTSPLSTLVNPNGECTTAPSRSAPKLAALFAPLVWVRSCRGQYALLRVPIAG